MNATGGLESKLKLKTIVRRRSVLKKSISRRQVFLVKFDTKYYLNKIIKIIFYIK